MPSSLAKCLKYLALAQANHLELYESNPVPNLEDPDYKLYFFYLELLREAAIPVINHIAHRLAARERTDPALLRFNSGDQSFFYQFWCIDGHTFLARRNDNSEEFIVFSTDFGVLAELKMEGDEMSPAQLPDYLLLAQHLDGLLQA